MTTKDWCSSGYYQSLQLTTKQTYSYKEKTHNHLSKYILYMKLKQKLNATKTKTV